MKQDVGVNVQSLTDPKIPLVFLGLREDCGNELDYSRNIFYDYSFHGNKHLTNVMQMNSL